MNRIFYKVAFSVGILLSSVSGYASEKLIQLNIAHVIDKETALGHSVERIAASLSKNGFEVKTHHAFNEWPGLKVKGELAGIQAATKNEIQVLFLTDGPCANIAQSCTIFTMPFLYKNTEEAVNVADNKQVLGELGNDFSKAGFKLLAIYENGWRQIYSKNEQIVSPDQIMGKKFRVMQSNAYMMFVTSMGGTPTPIAWPSVGEATQKGIVHAFEAPLPIYYSSGLQKINNYVTISNHIYSVFYALVNTTFWESLPKDKQDTLTKTIWDERLVQRQENQKNEKKLLETLKKDKSIKVVELNESQINEFRSKTSSVYESFKPKYSPKLLEALPKK